MSVVVLGSVGLFSASLCFAKVDLISHHQEMLLQNYYNNKMAQLVQRAKKEISDRMYLTLATVDQNSSPWNAPVYSAYDKQYNFYWMSEAASQHSKNIRLNRKTFAVIYYSSVPEGTGFGVYLRGYSRELNSNNVDEIRHGIAIMGISIHRTDFPQVNNYLSPFPRRVYRFIPQQVWVNTVVKIQGKNVDRRVEISRCIL